MQRRAFMFLAGLAAAPLACGGVTTTAVDSDSGTGSGGTGGTAPTKADASSQGGGGAGGSAGAAGGGGISPPDARDAQNLGDRPGVDSPGVLGDVPPAPPPGAMVCDPPLDEKLTLEAGRQAHCVVDVGGLGNDDVSLFVISHVGPSGMSVRTERACKVRFPLHDKVVLLDVTKQQYSRLPDAEWQQLTDLLRTYSGMCTADKGSMIAAYTSEWHRETPLNPSNPNDDVTMVPGFKSLEGFVAIPKGFEGVYTYFGAARSLAPATRPGRFVIDPGWRSFIVSGREGVGTNNVKISLGHIQAGNDFFAKKDTAGKFVHGSYEAARTAYEAALKAALASKADNGPGTAGSAESVMGQLLGAVRSGGLNGKEIVVESEDGTLLLAAQGKLYGNGTWVDEATYLALLAQIKKAKTMDPSLGLISGVLAAADTEKIADIFKDSAAFEALRNSPAWNVYGAHLMARPVLLNHIGKLCGTEKFMLLPRGLETGITVRRAYLAQ